MLNRQRRKTYLALAILAISGVLVVPISRISAEACPVSPTDEQLNRTCDPTPSPDPDLIASYNAQIAEKQKKIEDLNNQSNVYIQQIDSTQGQLNTLKNELRKNPALFRGCT